MKKKDYVLGVTVACCIWLLVHLSRSWNLELNQDDDVGDAETEHFIMYALQALCNNKIEER